MEKKLEKEGSTLGKRDRKINYTNYSNKTQKIAEPTKVIQSQVEVEEPITENTKVESVTGVVVNCGNLNIRQEPSIDGEILCSVPVFTELEVCIDDKSTDEWFHVYTASGIEGFCMRQYVDVCL